MALPAARQVDVMDTGSSWTPLMRVSAVSGNQKAASLLIEAGADVNVKDKDGKTPLMVGLAPAGGPVARVAGRPVQPRTPREPRALVLCGLPFGLLGEARRCRHDIFAAIFPTISLKIPTPAPKAIAGPKRICSHRESAAPWTVPGRHSSRRLARSKAGSTSAVRAVVMPQCARACGAAPGPRPSALCPLRAGPAGVPPAPRAGGSRPLTPLASVCLGGRVK